MIDCKKQIFLLFGIASCFAAHAQAPKPAFFEFCNSYSLKNHLESVSNFNEDIQLD